MTEQINITEEQAQQIKEQLLNQLDNFPEDKRTQIQQQIKSMTTEQVKEFIKQNQLSHLNPNQCIFCSLVSGDTPSIKIAEDNNNIAILEINPLTRAHTLIIPKNHKNKPSKDFATKIGELLLQKLNAKDIQVQESEVMNHAIMNLIPTYEDTDLKSTQRTTAKKQDLENLKNQLTTPTQTQQITQQAPKKIQTQSLQPKKPEPITKLKPRIP